MILSILPRETTRSRQKAVPVMTVRLLLQDVAEGIRVFQTRDGVDLSDEQILERARNIVTGLLGNYRIRSLDPTTRGSRPRPIRWTSSTRSRRAPKRATTAAPAAPSAAWAQGRRERPDGSSDEGSCRIDLLGLRTRTIERDQLISLADVATPLASMDPFERSR